jgi:hypothetical protein
MARKSKKGGHDTFHGKVGALLSKGFSFDSAKRIVGAEIQHAKGKLTKAERKARAAATRAAKALHERFVG